MKEAFLEGLMRGGGVVFFMAVAILTYLAMKGKITSRSKRSVARSGEKTQSTRSERLVRSAKSCCILVGGAVFVLAIFYVYLTGIHEYGGVVRDKVAEKVAENGARSLYFVTIDNTNYQVDHSLYAAVNRGDTMRQPMLRPWVYVNDRKVFYEDTIRDGGFWLGFVGSACAVMCLWALAGAVKASRPDGTR